MNYQHALVIGRFQPFHQGHVFLIESALKLAEKVTICIGSANISNEDNPFPYEIRYQMITKAIQKNKWEPRIQQIIRSDDIPDDNEWLQNIVQKLPLIDIVIGNNDWVNGIFEQAGYKIKELDLHNRDQYQGKTIRKLIADKSPQWKTYVPDYVVSILEQ